MGPEPLEHPGSTNVAIFQLGFLVRERREPSTGKAREERACAETGTMRKPAGSGLVNPSSSSRPKQSGHAVTNQSDYRPVEMRLGPEGEVAGNKGVITQRRQVPQPG